MNDEPYDPKYSRSYLAYGPTPEWVKRLRKRMQEKEPEVKA